MKLRVKSGGEGEGTDVTIRGKQIGPNQIRTTFATANSSDREAEGKAEWEWRGTPSKMTFAKY